jgi:hypothetical protein
VNGIIQTALLLLLCASRLQRWLLGIGLAMVLIGCSGLWIQPRPSASSGFMLLAPLGIVTAVIGPVLTDGLLFRMLSAPSVMALIRFGRLKLLLGQLAVLLLVSLLTSAVMTVALARTRGPLPPMAFGIGFAIVFGIATLFFLAFYCSSRFRYGGLVFLATPLLAPLIATLSHLFSQHPMQNLLLTPPGLIIMGAAEILAWPVFGFFYLNARHIEWMSWVLGTVRAPATVATAGPSRVRHYPRQDAIRMLLMGNHQGRLQWCLRPVMTVAIFLVLAAALPLFAGHHPLSAAMLQSRIRILLPCAVAGVPVAIIRSGMMRRARAGWLAAGLGRLELFATVERYGWYTLLIAAGTAWIIAFAILRAAGIVFAIGHFPGLVILPLASGATFLYVNLLLVRGPNRRDTLISAGFAVLTGTNVIGAFVAPESVFLDWLVAAQILCLPLLRSMAARRWQALDWLAYRPLQPQPRLAR